MLLIGVSDHEKIALKDLFSPYLIPSLHPDLQHHIMSQLHVNIQELAEEFQQSHPDLIFGLKMNPLVPTKLVLMPPMIMQTTTPKERTWKSMRIQTQMRM
jgi:hypothetical protein